MTDSHQGLPFPRRAIAVIAMCVGSLLLMIDSSIAAVALPTIAKALGVQDSMAVMVVTAYQLILAMTVLPFAALGERIGLRRLYQAGLLIHCVTGSLVFFADNLIALVSLRSLQALGTAAAISVAPALVRATYPAEQLGRGLSINTIVNAGATALAPVICGLILSFASWHWVFAIVVPFSIASLMFSRALPEPEPQQHRFDWLGAILCASTFGLIISGLEGVIHSNYLTLSICIIAIGVVSGFIFVRHELKEARPVLPIDLLRMPVIARAVIASFIAVIGSIVLMLYVPFRLQQQYGFSPGEIGGVMAAYAVMVFIVAPTAGALSDHISASLLTSVAMLIASFGLLSIALLPDQPTHVDIVLRMALCGFGFGMFSTPNSRLIIASAPITRTASAGSIFSTARMLSLTMGAILVAALLDQGLGKSPIPAIVAMSLSIVAGLICISSFYAEKAKARTDIGR